MKNFAQYEKNLRYLIVVLDDAVFSVDNTRNKNTKSSTEVNDETTENYFPNSDLLTKEGESGHRRPNIDVFEENESCEKASKENEDPQKTVHSDPNWHHQLESNIVRSLFILKI